MSWVLITELLDQGRIFLTNNGFSILHPYEMLEVTLHRSTNNMRASRNNAFNNPTIWTCIQAVKKDNRMGCLDLCKHECGILFKNKLIKNQLTLHNKLK